MSYLIIDIYRRYTTIRIYRAITSLILHITFPVWELSSRHSPRIFSSTRTTAAVVIATAPAAGTAISTRNIVRALFRSANVWFVYQER